MTDLFISHSTADDTHADRLADALQTHGITAWLDHRGGLKSGTPNWDREIRANIQACSAALLLMSPRSLASDICSAECLTVRELGKPLYVAYLETCQPAEIWLYIKMIQYADLRADFSAAVTGLVSALRGEKSGDGSTPTPVRGKITGADLMRVNLPYPPSRSPGATAI